MIFLEKLKKNCVKQKTFERLIKNGDIYSIRLIGNKNIRILFTFAQYYSREIDILLYCFEEKNKKKNSKDSYVKAINIAKARMNELIE